MNSFENDKPVENEISLVNIFFFFLRYRKLILCGTGIGAVLAVIWLFVCPAVFKTTFATEDTYNVSYTITSVNPPSCVLRELGNNISVAALSQSRMKQTKYVMNQNKKYPVFGGEDKDGYDYNNYVKYKIGEYNFTVGSVIVGTEYEISCDLAEKEFDLFDQFIKGCVEDTNKNLEDYIFPVMENVNTDEHPEVISYKNNYKSLISIEGKPLILKNRTTSRVKKLIVAVMAFFVLFFLIAFVKNDMSKIKQDEFLSSKLSSAWNEGKFRKNK